VSIQPGTRLGQYEVQDLIGQGAMGVVYRAYHVQLERTGAVKVLQGLAPDTDSTARFRHEAQAIAQMRHPNIVNVFDFGEYEGTPYMIIEYVPGGSLASRMKQGSMDTAAALKYLRGMAAGLDYAHTLGIVHRDVKPANVLLEKDESPVIADFGLVKLMQSTSLKSMTGVTTGTPAYMSPEQVTGSKVGPPADRYSLATIAYEMLTGSIPFDGEGLMEVLYAQVHRDPPLPSARNSSLNPQVDAVIMRGLAKDPAARWESCAAFVDALAAALAGKADPAMARTVVMAPPVASPMPLATPAAAAAAVATAPPADRVNPSATVAMPYPAPAQPVAKKKSRKGLIAVVIAAALVVLLILGIIVIAALTPTLSLSASTVRAGDTVVVNARHLPANQIGEVQLLSVLHTFAFHANASGDVSLPILVPKTIGAGDHTVRLCWASSCRLSKTLHVTEPVAFATPSPGSTPSTAPGASPTPGSTPVGGTSPSPAPSPIASPVATPRVTPTPPPPPPTPYVTIDKISQVNGFTAVLHYTGGGTWSISVVDVTLGRSFPAGTASVPSGNTYYSQHFATPTGVLATNQAYVMACNNGTCYKSSQVAVVLN
jgi:eukaryotic-like serine/threonine-protein kinase